MRSKNQRTNQRREEVFDEAMNKSGGDEKRGNARDFEEMRGTVKKGTARSGDEKEKILP